MRYSVLRERVSRRVDPDCLGTEAKSRAASWLAAYVGAVSVDEVVSWVNETHEVSYVVLDRLEGGIQSGVYLLRRPDGVLAVLKWSPNRGWARQVLRAAPIVGRVRQRGYPTPAWLAVGTTDRGFPYQVQEFVEGSPLPMLDESAAEILLEVIDRQAKLDPDPDRNWSEYAKNVVFGDGRARLKASGDAGATVVDAFDRLCEPIADVGLPAGDMVHGDLSLDNVLTVDGKVSGVIDIEAIGSGSRVFDLAAVIRSAYLFGRADTPALDRLRQSAEDVAGLDVLRIFAAATLYDILNFGLERWNNGIEEAVPAALQLAADL
jgi:aminoglycoside phosphotransferase (APT) family kinase protein